MKSTLSDQNVELNAIRNSYPSVAIHTEAHDEKRNVKCDILLPSYQ